MNLIRTDKFENRTNNRSTLTPTRRTNFYSLLFTTVTRKRINLTKTKKVNNYMKIFPRKTKHKRKHFVSIEKALFNSQTQWRKILLKTEKRKPNWFTVYFMHYQHTHTHTFKTMKRFKVTKNATKNLKKTKRRRRRSRNNSAAHCYATPKL